ncbi:hypothetical protein KBW71_00125 [Hydrogenophaga aromaticivorans]|uniref:hypothetical protein n=1 Tax=Hydrogenophaga aromaticivorans TaxID=2610898 RepID=UPI001B397E9A|nr:hypothetical protein [Hydrogenophaga aromaticivorans]MBQ0916855.1 hypothetical protein [Hydrogenophaga aromaticivorans]
MFDRHEEVGTEQLKVLEFQYLDPATGAWMSMLADEDGFRPATAGEVVELGLRNDAFPGGKARVDALQLELDAFIAKYTHSFPDEDDFDVLAPSM